MYKQPTESEELSTEDSKRQREIKDTVQRYKESKKIIRYPASNKNVEMDEVKEMFKQVITEITYIRERKQSY